MRMFHRLIPFCLVTTLLLGACTSPRPVEMGPVISYDSAADLGYRIGFQQWLATPSDAFVSNAAILGDQLVVLEQPSQLITALDMRTGEINWRHALVDSGHRVYGPYAYGDTILINTARDLHVLDAETGELKHILSLGGMVVESMPGQAERYAIFGSIRGRIFAMDVTTGLVHWNYQLSANIVTAPLTFSNLVFVTDNQGVYALLNSLTGQPIWRGRAFAGIVAQSAYDATRLYVPSTDNGLYALSRTTGRDQWTPPYRTTVPLTQAPMVDRNDLFLPRPGLGLICLQATTGQVNWQSDLDVQPIQVIDGQLLVRDANKLYRLDRQNGQQVAQAAVTHLAVVLPGPDRSLILITRDGRIVQLRALGS